MQADFHYSVVKVLAMKAGMEHDEAETIAYASQYVDDNRDRFPMTIHEAPSFFRRYMSKETYVPCTTMHKLPHYVAHFKNEDLQRGVLIAFHFLPPTKGKRSFVVKPNGGWARDLVLSAIERVQTNRKGAEERLEALISLGVALHTYADTWSHQGFTGTYASLENDVSELLIPNKRGRLRKKSLWVLMELGHAEAGSYPDHPYLKWKYRNGNGLVDRDNPAGFIKAAREIYDLLRSIGGAKDDWESLEKGIKTGIGYRDHNCKRRMLNWRRLFREVPLIYDEEEWKVAALDQEDGDTEDQYSDSTKNTYTALTDPRWFYFQTAVTRQREAVLNGLPSF